MYVWPVGATTYGNGKSYRPTSFHPHALYGCVNLCVSLTVMARMQAFLEVKKSSVDDDAGVYTKDALVAIVKKHNGGMVLHECYLNSG